MNLKILSFVSLAAVLLSGCSHSYSNGVLTTSSILGSNVKSGFTERSDVNVTNYYPQFTMEVTLQEIIVPHTAQRGLWNDPILGTPLRPSFGEASKPYVSLVKGQGLKVPFHRIITQGNYLAVFVSWYDERGQCVGESSEVFLSGNSYYPDHYCITPSIGRFGTVLGRVIQKS